MVVKKQRQWLASYPLEKILSNEQLPWFFALPVLNQPRPKIKKGLLSSATFQVIFHTVYYDQQMIYDQWFCYFCVVAGNLCLVYFFLLSSYFFAWYKMFQPKHFNFYIKNSFARYTKMFQLFLFVLLDTPRCFNCFSLSC